MCIIIFIPHEYILYCCMYIAIAIYFKLDLPLFLVYLERCIPLTLFELCPLCGVGGNLGLLPRVGMRIFVNLKGLYACIYMHICNIAIQSLSNVSHGISIMMLLYRIED